MKNCFICNEPMEDKKTLMENGETSSKFAHREHIIQNVIGWRLKSKSVLYEQCDGELNNEICADFFNPFLYI